VFVANLGIDIYVSSACSDDDDGYAPFDAINMEGKVLDDKNSTFEVNDGDKTFCHDEDMGSGSDCGGGGDDDNDNDVSRSHVGEASYLFSMNPDIDLWI
jgi:hypothetical protein